jgi:predicted RNase H-like nuclease (RuvC/YqgF family)
MFKIDKKYNSDIQLFCELNKITDVNSFVTQCFKQGFDIKKYGLLGNSLNEGEKEVIKEVIVEKQVEIPVEVIREVIKEVPVEVIKEIIKEVPVEKVVTKIEYISDKTTENELGKIITKLEEEMSKKDKELDELRHNLDIALDKPPVEIIKEVEVIKEVENNEKLKMMGETLQKIRKELSFKDKKIEELESINKQLESIKVSQGAVYLKGSNITQRL